MIIKFYYHNFETWSFLSLAPTPPPWIYSPTLEHHLDLSLDRPFFLFFYSRQISRVIISLVLLLKNKKFDFVINWIFTICFKSSITYPRHSMIKYIYKRTHTFFSLSRKIINEKEKNGVWVRLCVCALSLWMRITHLSRQKNH